MPVAVISCAGEESGVPKAVISCAGEESGIPASVISCTGEESGIPASVISCTGEGNAPGGLDIPREKAGRLHVAVISCAGGEE